MTVTDTGAQAARVGAMLAQRRKASRLSQLDLALEAGISARHLSFVETGRAQPSRDMVMRLCDALGVKLRERNPLLLAAGFAPLYRETPPEAPEMREMLTALGLILEQNEPFPAVAFDRNWDILMANRPYAGIVGAAMPAEPDPPCPLVLLAPPRPNVLRLLFRPNGLKRHIVNWEAVAGAVLARARREVAADRDPARQALLDEIVHYPEIPPRLLGADHGAPDPLIIPVELRGPDGTIRLLSTIATLGTAQDITLRELRIESFHPADRESDRWVRATPD